MPIPEEAFEFLDGAMEMHITELKSGAVRGNHWHDNRNEVMVVQADSQWQFAWSEDKDTPPAETLSFAACEFAAILIPRLTCHAIRNCGEKPIWVAAIADGKYDGITPDTYARILL